MLDIRLFADAGVTYTLDPGLKKVQETSDMLNNGSCPTSGITDKGYLFHEWGSFTIHFDAGSPDPMTLVILQEDDKD